MRHDAPGDTTAFRDARSFSGATLTEMFDVQARRHPDGIAVQLGDERLTYRELEIGANRLADRILGAGGKPGTLVAVYFERSIEMIVAMLAVLKAGAAYLPIDPTSPVERIKSILDDADPSMILAHRPTIATVQDATMPVLCVERGELSGGDVAVLRGGPVRPDSGAYVIYTSGSTGKPKGVMISHHNVVRLLRSTDAWFGFNSADVWTLFHSSAFDFSVWEIWGCLLSGGRLVCVPKAVARSPKDFYQLVATEGVTVLNQTPGAFYQLVRVDESESRRPLALRCVIFGGEALNFAALRGWFDRHGDAGPQLVNMYGITETTVHVTYRRVTRADTLGETRSLIGRPIPDLHLYLLDDGRKPVPAGTVGEIYVGGAGVAQGYLNRPELTAERFLPDPFCSQPGARMYRSGDLGRWLAPDDLEYLGRADMQVKIRGHRIELGEIEATLIEHPAVQQAVVLLSGEGAPEPRLIAYVVPRGGQVPAASDLRAFLRDRLPEYMLPAAYVDIKTIPLTVNGKVDRAALPRPVEAARNAEPVSTQLEQMIADAWRAVLGIQNVGLDDNFFDLGGTSFSIVVINERLQAALQQEISMTDMFEFATVRTLARRLAGAAAPDALRAQTQERAQRQMSAFARQRNRRMGQ